MRNNSRSDLAPLLIATAATVVLFIPAARLLDSLYPGPHAGFTLMGIWLYLVVPGAAVFVAAALALYPRVAARGMSEGARFRRIAWLIWALLLVAAMVAYRSTA